MSRQEQRDEEKRQWESNQTKGFLRRQSELMDDVNAARWELKKLNPDKTEFIVLGADKEQTKLANHFLIDIMGINFLLVLR